MNTQTLLEAYNKLNLPKMQATDASITTTQLMNPADALQWYIHQKPISGWLQLQQKDIAFNNGNITNLNNPEYGFLMQAEGCVNESTSIAIKYDGAGAYLATIIRLTQGNTYLMDEVKLIGTAKAPGKSNYKRLWDMQTKRPMLAMFNGFESDKS